MKYKEYTLYLPIMQNRYALDIYCMIKADHRKY